MSAIRAHRPRAWRAATALLLCLVVTAGRAGAQQLEDGRWMSGVSEPWWFGPELDKAEVAAAQARWKLIGEERGGGVWAGDYFVGSETHGAYLRWSPAAGFVLFKVNKCAAQVDDFSYGRVVAAAPLVVLAPERAMQPRGAHSHGHHPSGNTYVPVEFRGVRLLVAEDEMPDFGDYAAGLGRFNAHTFIHYVFSTAFFQQFGEQVAEVASASDAVVVPPGYERFLKRPITGSITSVGKRVVRRDYSLKGQSGEEETFYTRASVTHVTVNVGSDHGAAAGLRLRTGETDDEVLLTRVGRASSSGVVIRSLDENGRATYYHHDTDTEKVYPRVAAGWRLTTSPF